MIHPTASESTKLGLLQGESSSFNFDVTIGRRKKSLQAALPSEGATTFLV
jgi:hypothetical protein